MTRALVLGAGIGGIAAAAALRTAVDDVVLIERDRLPSQPMPRRGVPQAGQLHNLLTAAQDHLETLLPGFLSALSGAGGRRAVVASDTHVHELGVRMPERDVGLALVSAPRPVIEQVARDLLRHDAGIQIREGVSIEGLRLDRHAVSGVLLAAEGSTGPEVLDADLIVDAMGTGSAVARWLDEAGFEVPEESHLVERWYASALVRRPADLGDSDRFWLVFPTAPNTRGGLASPVDDDHLYVSLSGSTRDDPPRDHVEYRAYAASLEDPVLLDLLTRCTPVSEPAVFRKMHATWRHYEEMVTPVVGLVPLGDAYASLNPLFGQGMSVAARQAAMLADILATSGVADIEVLTRAYLDDAARAIRMAWDLGAISEPTDDVTPLLSDPRHARALGELLSEDPALHRHYVRVWHLLEPVSSLDASEIVDRVAARVAAADAPERLRA